MRKIRLSSALLAIIIAGLIAALVVQERRIARIESEILPGISVFDTPLPPLPASGTSPFDAPIHEPAAKPSIATAPTSRLPSRSLPSPAAPVKPSREEQIRALNLQIEFLTKQKERILNGEDIQTNAPPPPASPDG